MVLSDSHSNEISGAYLENRAINAQVSLFISSMIILLFNYFKDKFIV